MSWMTTRQLIGQYFPHNSSLLKVVPRFPQTRSCSAAATSNEDRLAFVEYLNTASEDDLQSWKSLTKSHRDAILHHRQDHRQLQDLSEALQIKGLGRKTLNSFASEFLGKDAMLDLFQKATTTKNRYHLKRNQIHPKYITDKMPSAVLSCGIQLDAVYWSRVTKDLTVTHWDYCTLYDMQRKYDHVLYQQKMWQVMHKLPPADVYLLEDSPIIVSNVASVGGALNRARLETLLTSLLNSRQNTDNSEPFKHTVHKIKASDIGSYFGLLVGGHRTSAQQTVSDLCQRRSRRPIGDLYFPSEQLECFFNSRRATKEQLSNCLIQTIMFYELLLKQDHDIEHSMDITS